MLQWIKSIRRRHHFISVMITVLMVASFPADAATQDWWVAAARDSAHPKPAAYIQKLKTSGDDRTYFNSLAIRADRGDVTAQYIVAIAYINGRGVSQNKMAGKRWLTRASDQGHTRAASLLNSGISTHHTFADNPELSNTASPQPADTATAIVSPELLAPPTEKELDRQREERELVTKETETPSAQSDDDTLTMLESIIKGVDWQKSLDTVLAILSKPYAGIYWTWWMGALGLAFLTVGFWVVTGNTLGVSSSWDRLVSFRDSRKAQKASEAMAKASANDVERAMMEATLAEFGDDLSDDMREQMRQMESAQPTQRAEHSSREQRAPFGAHVLFLLFMTLGGTLAAFTAGDLNIQHDMGEKFVSFFGNGVVSWIVLLIGGFLVGFGTRMGGGCTSGHGLSGCSRLQFGSLVGTAAFFGTAIGVSMLLAAMLA
jgi:uncharacterized membrane protein YedE/YeeE